MSYNILRDCYDFQSFIYIIYINICTSIYILLMLYHDIELYYIIYYSNLICTIRIQVSVKKKNVIIDL